MASVALSFAVVFVAELGDKTQLLTLGLAARRGVPPVLAGVTAVTALISTLSVAAGASLRGALPAHLTTVVTPVGSGEPSPDSPHM